MKCMKKTRKISINTRKKIKTLYYYEFPLNVSTLQPHDMPIIFYLLKLRTHPKHYNNNKTTKKRQFSCSSRQRKGKIILIKKNDLVKQGINKKSQTDDVSCDFKR